MMYWVVLATLDEKGAMSLWSGEVYFGSIIAYREDVETLRDAASVALDLAGQDTVLISWSKLDRVV